MRIALFVLVIILLLSSALLTETIELGAGGVIYWGDGYFFRGEIGPGTYISADFIPKLKMLFGINWIKENGLDFLPWYILYYPSTIEGKIEIRYNANMQSFDYSILYNFLNHTSLSLWAGPCFDYNILKVKAFPLFTGQEPYEGKIYSSGLGGTFMVQTRLSSRFPVNLNLSGSFRFSLSGSEDDHFTIIFGKRTRSANLQLGLSYTI